MPENYCTKQAQWPKVHRASVSEIRQQNITVVLQFCLKKKMVGFTMYLVWKTMIRLIC